MTKRMLIDATHAEETRVVVLDGNRLDDFDVETSSKKQLKGNIYLAKVVRVEPSLQAAFVEYGGNRHGFLAFGEIHPDYYQIPVADRQRLLAMQAEEAREQEEADEAAAQGNAAHANAVQGNAASDASPAEPASLAGESLDESGAGLIAEQVAVAAPPEAAPDQPTGSESHDESGAGPVPEPAPEPVPAPPAEPDPSAGSETLDESGAGPAPENGPAEPAPPASESLDESGAGPLPGQVAVGAPAATEVEIVPEQAAHLFPPETPDAEPDAEAGHDEVESVSADAPPPETLGGETDGVEDARERRIPSRYLRNYKIQEVVRRRQILLVQVVKEERGTKGAALTTYISLAGRFCVLMPNSPRGGGISRKITSAADRRRLKEITAELDIPEGMGLIVRTAGANRPKPEIKRDCEYLLRLWDQIRETTLRSVAPALIYEEAALIKRAIRDGYSRDIDEVLVDGEDGWRAAHEYMRMLMPGHQQKVVHWGQAAGQPLFARYQVEAQLDAMLTPNVQLKSGGYLVINQTEALVAIDVNSGRSTRERNVEETALRTNMEAAEEAARQLRLRDLAGLIVIDFIDMESRKHNGMVERRLKDALKGDRARIQVGHISHFGLLEMSRQRLRPSLAETSFVTCPQCGGTGHVRNTESAAIHVLRGIEEEAAKRRTAEVMVHVAGPIAMYILNHKRDRLHEVEARYGLRVLFNADPTLIPPQVRLERLRAPVAPEAAAAAPDAEPAPPVAASEPEVVEPAEAEAATAAESPEQATEAQGADESEQRRRRRRRRRGRRDEGSANGALPELAQPGAEQPDGEVPPREPGATERPVEAQGAPAGDEAGEEDQRGRHRGRRGGRRRRRDAPAPIPGPIDGPIDAPINEPIPGPIVIGPTPADPYGGQAFDVFDAIEQAEQPPLPLRAPPPPMPEQPAEAAVPAPPEPAEAPVAEQPDAAPAFAYGPPNGAAQQVLPAHADAAPELEPEPAVKPVVIDSGAPAVERKRGWWRR
ncbi:MAG: Rne/Rng family ribonuclease [Acidisphaera sp.]|nr:Rne/Rng family ribonuclease [Acidisphaera sp.]